MTAVTAELEKALAERDRLAGLLDLRDGELAHANEQRDMARTELDGARDRLRLLADAHRHWSTRAQRAEAEVASLRATVRGLTGQTQSYVDRAQAEGARIVILTGEVERMKQGILSLRAQLQDLTAEVYRLRAAIPDDIDPVHVRPMLRLLGPARMVLDQLAEALGGQAGPWMDEAADMAQRIVDWIGHPVTDEPAWATLPCEQDGACGTCRPCLARVRAGYRPGLVGGAPVIDDRRDAGVE